MSVNGPGQYGGYTPPPPSMNGMPRKGRSPWVYVGLGCGGLAVLSFAGCVAFGVIIANKAKQEMSRPVSEASIKQGLGDVLVYPDAQLDVNTTHGMNITMPIFRKLFSSKDDGTVGVFRSEDSLDKVLSWYDKKLTAKGFKKASTGQSQMVCFQKGTEVVGIQETNSAKVDKGTAFTLLDFKEGKVPQ